MDSYPPFYHRKFETLSGNIYGYYWDCPRCEKPNDTDGDDHCWNCGWKPGDEAMKREIGDVWKEEALAKVSKPWYVQFRGFRESYPTKKQAERQAERVKCMEQIAAELSV